ncbi:MAG: anti-sigma F factor [Clostridia bacterium]|jgi:stage II sporulation protein AB (anti-sigma F factor)|nr:anti-sigma F factor [Clostridia bacterium]MDH7572693.1 anti-sigma F factor [Clostridia bacterium]
MSEIVNSMRLEFLSRKENLGLARVAVASFASQLDFTLNDLEEIKVAVSEAVTNAIVHGYENQAAGLVRIACNLYPDALEIIVNDEGKGMAEVAAALEPGRAAEGDHVGLGFIFMRSFMNEVQVDSAPGRGTTVRLVRRLGQPLQACARQN